MTDSLNAHGVIREGLTDDSHREGKRKGRERGRGREVGHHPSIPAVNRAREWMAT